MHTSEPVEGRAFDYTIEGGRLEVVFRGRVVELAIREARAVCYGDPRFRPTMTQLVDFSSADLSSIGPEALRALAEQARTMSAEWGDRRIGVVASRDVDYGLLRAYELWSDTGGRNGFRVFRDRAEAEIWTRVGPPDGRR